LEFIQRINQLANNFKANIIVDDLGFFGEPYFEDGDLADAVAALPSDILYISSAGNSGNTHYEDNFEGSPAPNSNFHEFSAGDESVGFLIGPNRFVLIIMQWNDPFNSPSTDLDLFVTNNNTTVGSSTADQSNPGTPPLEAVCVFNPSNTNIVNNAFVNRFSGATDRRLEMFFLGSPEIEYSRPNGSVFGHAGVPRALAIGTINASEPGNNSIAFYSSHGPSRVDFPSVVNRKKPDLIGIDGVSVTGAGGFSNPFFGTSAAAPHVAAVAAQLMSVSGKVTAKNVKDALTRGAVDLGSAGFDSTYGFGRVDGVAAKNVLIEGTILPPFLILLDD
jgi:subtilisin family serine protease